MNEGLECTVWRRRAHSCEDSPCEEVFCWVCQGNVGGGGGGGVNVTANTRYDVDV